MPKVRLTKADIAVVKIKTPSPVAVVEGENMMFPAVTVPGISAAIGSSAAISPPDSKIKLSSLVEKAMSEAIAKAQSEGISDPVIIRERIHMARKQAMKDALKA